ncbi:endothelin-converting enzyme 2 isoform X2 [Vigna radiata var. radiata]|uniref:Endothelin-converting enzyme 2 isoform X2 n=1 Tax=Vigna radiata var. radiata TaxID=3916 RepID=A0A3Q0EQS5_VIGRR|nr:endothelin-converting enzyme 2 isoform X2 [Vigna radiata var. radiata]
MYRDVSSCNTYNYGDALYWDARYIQEGGSFDWYQRYSALRPFVRNFIPLSSRILMVGCGNAVMSEDMVKDGYEHITNIDISSVAIEMMRRKYEYIPQLKYLQMDVRDMSLFPDESFDGVIDKGTLDSLMITYGDPTVRMPHLSRPVFNWKIMLYNIPRPGFQKPESSTPSRKSYLEPIPLSEKGLLPADFVLEDPDSHFIYVCKKINDTEIDTIPTYQLTADVL